MKSRPTLIPSTRDGGQAFEHLNEEVATVEGIYFFRFIILQPQITPIIINHLTYQILLHSDVQMFKCSSLLNH